MRGNRRMERCFPGNQAVFPFILYRVLTHFMVQNEWKWKANPFTLRCKVNGIAVSFNIDGMTVSSELLRCLRNRLIIKQIYFEVKIAENRGF